MSKIDRMKMLGFSLLISFSFVGLTNAGKIQPEKATIKKYISNTENVSEWKTYHNENWDYSVEYPVIWNAAIVLENKNKPEYVIKNRVRFSSPEDVEITIDVWTNSSSPNFAEWFEKNKKWVVSDDAEIIECKSAALKLSAICAKEYESPQAHGELKSIFQKGLYIYRVRYVNSDNNLSENIYNRILSSFNFK